MDVPCEINYQYYTITLFYRDPYTNDQKEMIDDAILSVQKLLVKNNLEPMPLDYYQYFNQTIIQWIRIFLKIGF